jgi:hypothetical protein
VTQKNLATLDSTEDYSPKLQKLKTSFSGEKNIVLHKKLIRGLKIFSDKSHQGGFATGGPLALTWVHSSVDSPTDSP